jgi:apolipoprotein N-acyltransferase
MWRLNSEPTAFTDNVKVRLVQPAVDQAEKWTPDVQDRHFGSLLDLSRDGGTGKALDDISVLVWPESAFPFILTRRKDALTALGELLPSGTILIAGAVRLEADEKAKLGESAFNAVYTINDEGVVTGASDKVHLVPFGEYLPFQKLAEHYGLVQLTHLRGGFQSGRTRQVLDAGPAGRFVPLICYEIIFPGKIVGEIRPDWLLNVTNDAWFGISPGPYQHWRQAVIRGVEEGLPVVRVANSGISSVTDANGRVIAKIDLGTRAALDSPLPKPLPATLFANNGNLIFFGLVAIFAATLLFPAIRN